MVRDAVAPEQASRHVHVLFAVQLVSVGAMEMSGPFWPIHLRTLATSGFEFGFAAVAVYIGPMLGMMLTSARWGRLGDRTGHKLMMIRALLALALTQATLGLADNVWTVIALRFIQGTCAGYIAPAQAYGVAIVAPSRRARLFAYLQTSTNIGSIVGALAGGVILDHATFFWINIAAALLCGGCALAVALAVPHVRAPQPASPERHEAAADASGSAGSWTASPIAGLLAIMGVLLMSRTMTQTPFSLYVDTVFHVGNWATGLCYGLMSLGFAASASLWARYFEKKSPREALQRMTFIAVACASLVFVVGTTRDIRLFAALYFTWGVLLAATTPVLMSLISHVASGRRQGHLIGVAQSTTQSSSIAGIALGGWLSQTVGLQYIYFFVSAAYAIAIAVIVGVTRERSLAAQSAASSGH
jgi:MFS transporter, DHA1 family, staphyloferrin B biosynthesis exporter